IPTTAHTCFFAIFDLRGSARWRRRGGSASVRRRSSLRDPRPRAARSVVLTNDAASVTITYGRRKIRRTMRVFGLRARPLPAASTSPPAFRNDGLSSTLHHLHRG